MSQSAKEKIIVAVDVPNADAAARVMDELGDAVRWVKIGLQLFTAEGPSIVNAARERGYDVFLDLKFHDIPNTAREGVRSAVALGVGMTTIHLCGGGPMVSAAVEAAGSTLVLGVTVLTSMDAAILAGTGVLNNPADQVLHLARLGTDNGLRGVVASPHEISRLRKAFGRDLTIVTPGVRPAGADAGDQKRIMPPAEAISLGADYLVIGRPIFAAPSPRDAVLRITEEIATAVTD